MNDVFRQIWRTLGQPMLTDQGYELQGHIATQQPPAIPEDVFLPYIKSLDSLGYAHVILGYSAHPRAATQRFSIQLLRYDDTEPYEAFLGPRISNPRTFLAGYLPNEERPPLPLGGSRWFDQWHFSDQHELRQKLAVCRERLDITILPWLETPTATQWAPVDKAWYRRPFERYCLGEVTAAQAYDAVKWFLPEGYFLDAGTLADTALVYEVNTILRSETIEPHPAKRCIRRRCWSIYWRV
jgi:hypothetical protein